MMQASKHARKRKSLKIKRGKRRWCSEKEGWRK